MPLCFVMAVAALAPSRALATFPGENGLIAYVSSGKLRTIQPDGTGGQSIIGNGSSPTWSASGRRIAFVHYVNQAESRIFTIRPNSGDLHYVTRGDAPSFSPGGGRIVFTRHYTDGPIPVSPIIYIARVKDGSKKRRIVWGDDPTWSPDGRLIAFQKPFSERKAGIWTIHPDGTHLRRLTDAPPDWFDESPDFSSPDGRWIVFSRNDRFEGQQTLRVRPSGRGLRKLPCVFGEPSYSPDGKGFVSATDPRYFGADVYVTYPGCPARALTTSGRTGARSNSSPAWQPVPGD